MKSESFDLQPVLDGTLIRLRPLSTDDFEALYRCASDPLIWEQHPEPTRYQEEVFQVFFDGAIQSKGAFAVIERSKNVVIGTSRYYSLAPERREVTVGYTFLTREYWGGRFNFELKKLMLEHAFQYVDVVSFEIGEANLRSRTAIERIGARLAELRSFDGNPHVIYKIEKKSFAEAFR
ncbi:MAG: GNAT family N-acetyltransferase [Bdellovibrionaceae bacterium]|nr:GNAT family N-acetyltransferase [Pseudobdellovibrionaceae bacterium]